MKVMYNKILATHDYKDRQYYRALSDRTLLDEINEPGPINYHELAIVLAERLSRALLDLGWESYGNGYGDDYGL
jgi:hypothetical protein